MIDHSDGANTPNKLDFSTCPSGMNQSETLSSATTSPNSTRISGGDPEPFNSELESVVNLSLKDQMENLYSEPIHVRLAVNRALKEHLSSIHSSEPQDLSLKPETCPPEASLTNEAGFGQAPSFSQNQKETTADLNPRLDLSNELNNRLDLSHDLNARLDQDVNLCAPLDPSEGLGARMDPMTDMNSRLGPHNDLNARFDPNVDLNGRLDPAGNINPFLPPYLAMPQSRFFQAQSRFPNVPNVVETDPMYYYARLQFPIAQRAAKPIPATANFYQNEFNQLYVSPLLPHACFPGHQTISEPLDHMTYKIPMTTANINTSNFCLPRNKVPQTSVDCTSDAKENAGKRELTALMIRNIDRQVTQKQMWEDIVKLGYAKTVNFFYLPIYFDSGDNKGYCFINFVSQHLAEMFRTEMGGRKLNFLYGDRKCSITLARLQGQDQYIAHFSKNPVMKIMDEDAKPWIIENGHRRPF
jgi:hypothetical protein